MAGRVSANRVVNFDAPSSLSGQIVDVHVTDARPNSLQGRLVLPA